MTPQNLESSFRLCIEVRNFEVNQLVARNNFFMVFQGVLLAGLAQASASAPPVVVFMICLVGVIASLMQAFMAAGAKYWQERWEAALEDAERACLSGDSNDTASLTKPLFGLSKSELESVLADRFKTRGPVFRLLVRRFSVSQLPIYAGYLFATAWLVLLLCTINGPFGLLVPPFIVGFPR